MPINRAAWLIAKQAYPLEIREAAYTEPGDDEVLLKVHYVALNPADWKMIKGGTRITKFPMIIGQDVAGEVVRVGKAVNNITARERVIAHLMSVITMNAAEGAFQNYAIAKAIAVAPIPLTLSFERAVVLPLALSTATVGLYMKNQLGLPLPALKRPSHVSEQVLLVWGGSSSVGATIIQLAKASSLRVAATCSPRNNEFVKSAGAEWIFDYSSQSVVSDIVNALKDKDLVGAFNAIGGEESGNACVEIVDAIKSPSNKRHVATVPPEPSKIPEGVKVVTLGSAATMFLDAERKSIATYVWQEFVPKALKSGLLKALPEPLVAGEGLGAVQNGLDLLEQGVSAKKVVIKIIEGPTRWPH